MIKKPSVAQYTQSNILLVPESLFAMADVKTLLWDGDSVVFFKDLENDLVDIEFCTNAPCLVYIQAGKELITTSTNEQLPLESRDLVFFPKGLNLFSDYRGEDGQLKAFLVFFSQDVVTEYLASKKKMGSVKGSEGAAFKVASNRLFDIFFNGLEQSSDQIAQSKPVIKYKLLELLHLVDLQDGGNLLSKNLSTDIQTSSKRNIVRLMNQYALSNLTVTDLAALSGRSIASFNRDFKKAYSTTPKRWLLEKRLEHANTLLAQTDQTVTDIALQVGYENVSHFIKAFKTKYGVTPKQLNEQKTAFLIDCE